MQLSPVQGKTGGSCVNSIYNINCLHQKRCFSSKCTTNHLAAGSTRRTYNAPQTSIAELRCVASGKGKGDGMRKGKKEWKGEAKKEKGENLQKIGEEG